MYLRSGVCAVVAALLWGLCASCVEAGSLTLAGGQAVLQEKGRARPLPSGVFQVEKAAHAPFWYVLVGKEEAARYGLQAGVHLFHDDGTAAGVAAMADPGVCGDVYLSPNKQHVLVDNGTWLVRDLLVYSYPRMEAAPKAIITYVSSEASAPLWLDDEKLLYTTIRETSARSCDYDLCGPLSASVFSLRSGREAVVKRGDDLCDYWALRAERGRAVVGVRCLRRVEDWKQEPSGTPVREISVEVHEARVPVKSGR